MTVMIGKHIPRKEDQRLLRGKGVFSDDVNLPRQLYAIMVRSPHASARIRSIRPEAASRVRGVVAVLTGADFLADGLKPIPHGPFKPGPPDITLQNRGGVPPMASPHYPLPSDKVRFVGEAVAMVVAETIAIAKDAAEQVIVDYELLPAVTHSLDAVLENAPLIWEEEVSNTAIDADVGNAHATDAAFSQAAHVVSLETRVQRVTGVPMEPRAAVGDFDPRTRRYTLYAGSGNVVRQKRELASVLDAPPDSVRVVARDVGGNFGTRNAFYPEFALVVWAAKRVGRPVKWTCERQESFLSDYQGRDLSVTAELALDADGNFLAMRGVNTSNIGAHTVTYVPLTKGVQLMSSVYDVPAASFRARGVVTNTPSTNSYRSAGRPEAMFVVERLIDLAARNCGFDRVELRRRNIIRAAPGEYTNPFGLAYDCGAFESVMDSALSMSDWDGFPKRREVSEQQGLLRGIGVANYIEITSGVPTERTHITIDPEGRVDVVIGTLSSGQGHETSFAQLITEWLGVPLDRVRLITGDTDIVTNGGGSQSGRSMRLAGIVIGKAVDDIIAKAKRIAARVFDEPEANLQFSDGTFSCPESNRSLSLFEVASAAQMRNDLADDLRGPLVAECTETVRVGGFPYGCHVCEVEVDPETGVVDLLRYTAVDDVGRAINPLILKGQTHGGVAQGVGQALSEVCHYDPETGQLLAGSFMDYAMPRATTLPLFATQISEVPSPTNPLGIRAGGEGGTTPALGVVINAIVDALAVYGIDHIEMPATAPKIWRAIQDARSNLAAMREKA